MKNKIAIFTVIFGLILSSSLSCKENKKAKIVASTSWVASIAELAGIDDVPTIAPVNLKHPPEYEIKPMDILKVSQADLFIYAGYERMMKTISEAAEVDKSKIAKVKTTNTYENLSNMVKMLSEKAGTQKEAERRFKQYDELIQKTRQLIKETGLDKKTVYAHKDQAQLAKDLGLNVIATFGSAPLTSEQILFASENQIDIIIDNVHNPIASPAAEVCPNAKLFIWRNFPEKMEKNALYNVIKNNCESLFE